MDIKLEDTVERDIIETIFNIIYDKFGKGLEKKLTTTKFYLMDSNGVNNVDEIITLLKSKRMFRYAKIFDNPNFSSMEFVFPIPNNKKDMDAIIAKVTIKRFPDSTYIATDFLLWRLINIFKKRGMITEFDNVTEEQLIEEITNEIPNRIGVNAEIVSFMEKSKISNNDLLYI